MPEAVIIGGPNGAGKTSWARKYLRSTLGIEEFINADEIARELSPANPDTAAFSAGRLFIQRAYARVVAEQRLGSAIVIHDRGRWNWIEEATR